MSQQSVELVIFSNLLFPICIFMYVPVVTEEYVVTLIMEGYNSATTKIGVLREKRLYHPEKGK